ncbi:hypothetical protein FRC02_008427 [Tulasnella sp. 418]|nr:hypothetical protein FRC02_008427 [Tulasnella sp. 418]
MAKKKKLSLKPVNRGFATTSIPKKAVPEIPNEEDTEKKQDSATDASSELIGTSGSANEAGASSANIETKSDGDPEKAQWQAFVDKFQEKIEKEIKRAVKAVEFDRRTAKTFHRVNIDPVLCDRILSLAKEERALDAGSAKPRTMAFDEPEEKIITRLANTYGVLRRLGFSENRVEECLKAIDGVDLEEATEWLYLYCDEDELLLDNNEFDDPLKIPRTPTSATSRHTPTPTLPTTPSTPLSVTSTLHDVPVERMIPWDETNDSGSLLDINKQRILAAYGKSNEPSSADSTSSGRSSPEDPNAEWARVKLKWTIESKKRPPNAQLTSELKIKMNRIKGHYFFNQKDADAIYKTELVAYEKAALEERLKAGVLGGASKNLESAPPRTSEKKAPHNRKPSQLQLELKADKPPASVDILASTGDDEESDEEGIFGTMLDEMPSSEVDSNSNVVIQVRDMALPKHFSGKTPKKILEETVQKQDRHATVSYRTISGSSRAARAGVTVIRSGRMQEWDMIDVGCHSLEQAEQYIATVALHALTFVSQAGFAGAGANPSIFRLLPPVFRDLWDELELRRKTDEDETNRQVWAKLKGILKPKLGSMTKSSSKASKLVAPGTAEDEQPRSPVYDQSIHEQLIASFQARQSTAAFQEMKVQRDMLPIAAYRNTILEALDTSQVIVLSGETGCGKSTQLPSFILEDQLLRGIPAKIFCTEPRRISAISLAQRVSRELGEPPGAVGTNASLVGYSIRLESNTSRNTRLTFCTTGIALRMLEGGSGPNGKGSAFDEVTHIILDEVHERTIESDFLLIVLKSLLDQRKDLKVILMSATVDAEKISDFFGGCPTLHVPGRTFPVTARYLEDAIELTGWVIKSDSQYAKRLNDKYHRFDEKRQLSRLVDSFIARSNAAQRRGRAGRVREGLCFHLFTKQRHDTMLAEHPLPEMLRLSLSDLALRIKILRVKIGNSIEDVLSRALDPPSPVNIQRAVSSLVEVKALTPSEDITPMGRLLSKLPTDVHLGKFLLIAVILRCLDPALTIAATLSAKSPFITPFGYEQEALIAKNKFKTENSDFLTIHAAFASWRRVSETSTPSVIRDFCRKNYLSHQNLQQITELRHQFIGYLVDADFIQVDRAYRKEINKVRYRSKKANFLHIPPGLDVASGDSAMVNVALGAGLYPKIISIDPVNGLKTISNNQNVYFHPSSVNVHGRDFGVGHLCYFTIMHSKKLYVWETGPVEDLTLVLLCGDHEFKLLADSVFIDRNKIKFKAMPKTNIALKHLREQLASILATRMRGKELTESQKKWNDIAMDVLRAVEEL